MTLRNDAQVIPESNSTGKGLLGTRKKKVKEARIYLRLIINTMSADEPYPLLSENYVIKETDRKSKAVRRYVDKNMYSIGASNIEDELDICMTATMMKTPSILQISTNRWFIEPEFQIEIERNSNEKLNNVMFDPIIFTMQQLGTSTGKHENLNPVRLPVEITDQNETILKSLFNITVNESSSLMVSILATDSFAMLDDVQVYYNTSAMMVKNKDRNLYRGVFFPDGVETKFVEYKIYCLARFKSDLVITYTFVGDITYKKIVTVDCKETRDLAKSLKLNYPSSIADPNVKIIPITVSQEVGQIEIQSFEAVKVKEPIAEVSLVAPETKQGYLISSKSTAYLNFKCTPATTQEVRQGIVTAYIKSMNRVFKIESQVVCDSQPNETASVLLSIGSVLFFIFGTVLAILAVFHVYGRLKQLKARKLEPLPDTRRRYDQIVIQVTD